MTKPQGADALNCRDFTLNRVQILRPPKMQAGFGYQVCHKRIRRVHYIFSIVSWLVSIYFWMFLPSSRFELTLFCSIDPVFQSACEPFTAMSTHLLGQYYFLRPLQDSSTENFSALREHDCTEVSCFESTVTRFPRKTRPGRTTA